jgi:hypothetical protein
MLTDPINHSGFFEPLLIRFNVKHKAWRLTLFDGQTLQYIEAAHYQKTFFLCHWVWVWAQNIHTRSFAW